MPVNFENCCYNLLCNSSRDLPVRIFRLEIAVSSLKTLEIGFKAF